MHDNSPEISVIIPNYNRSEILNKAVDSVLHQTYRKFELIVVDDGSSVNIDFIKDKIIDAGHQFIKHDKNRGVAATRNSGIKKSKNEWIALLDSDDSWHPLKLGKQVEFLTQNREIKFFQCRENWYRNGKLQNQGKQPTMPNGDGFFESIKNCCISSSTVMFKRNLFDEFGGFNASMKVCEDYDLWIKISSKYSVGLLDEFLVDKFAGNKDQLSLRYPAMDRFRIFSLANILTNNDLSKAHVDAAVTVLRNKLKILIDGARKRGNKFINEIYSELLKQISIGERELIEKSVRDVIDKLEAIMNLDM